MNTKISYYLHMFKIKNLCTPVTSANECNETPVKNIEIQIVLINK